MANSKLEKSLGLIRKKIDLIDDQMLSLLEERVSLVIDAENLKKNTSKGPFYRPDREKEIIRRLQSLNNSPLEDNKIRIIFQDIISACFSTAFEIKVAYLGPEGSFSEKAAKKHFGSSTNFVSCRSIREIIDSVEDNSEYYGVLPIENSTEGLVNSTLDEIIESSVSYKNSKIGKKLKQTIYIGFDRGNNFMGAATFNEKKFPTHYEHLEEDFNYISDKIRLAFKQKDELHTINGPNKLLQIRTKASKVKGSYPPLIFRGHQLKNKYMVPEVEKIILNMGLGVDGTDNKIIKICEEDLAKITGQKPVITKFKKSIANFKTRKGTNAGLKVTLRKNKMYEFVDRLVNIALPRVKDFRGLSSNGFDKFGNYTFGIKEHIIFPEVNFDRVDKIRGLDITIVMSSLKKEHSIELLTKLNFPFKKKGDN